MTSSQSYKLNEPKVTAERLDGEFIILHFETGCYFSVIDTAADVCQLLLTGTATSEIVDLLVNHYELDREVMHQSVNGLVTQFIAEGLIVPTENTTDSSPTVPSFVGEFTEFTIEKFDDMSEQLLLDPIHEIDERGWPQAKQA